MPEYELTSPILIGPCCAAAGSAARIASRIATYRSFAFIVVIIPSPKMPSPLTVLALDLAGAQAADAIVDTGAIRHRQNENQLVRPRRVGDTDLDGVEMAAHISGIAVMKRHVDPRPSGPTLVADGTIALAPPKISRMP